MKQVYTGRVIRLIKIIVLACPDDLYFAVGPPSLRCCIASTGIRKKDDAVFNLQRNHKVGYNYATKNTSLAGLVSLAVLIFQTLYCSIAKGQCR